MSMQRFKLADNAQLINLNSLTSADLVVVKRIEEAFGRDTFTREEVLDVIGEDRRSSLNNCLFDAGYGHKSPEPKTTIVLPPALSVARCAMVSAPTAPPLTVYTPRATSSGTVASKN